MTFDLYYHDHQWQHWKFWVCINRVFCSSGLLFIHFLSGKAKWLDSAMPIVSMAGIAIIIVVITAAGRASLLTIGPALLLIVLVIAKEMGKIATIGLAPAIFGSLMNVTGSLLASYWHKNPPKEFDESFAREAARLFMHKVREAMKSNGNSSMDGNVHIDEFVVGGKETGKQGRSYSGKKKKTVCAVQLTEDGKVRRFYALF